LISPAERPASSAIARFPLWAALGVSALIYGALALWFPLAANVNRVPAADIRTFAPSLFGGLVYALLLLILFALLAMAFGRAGSYGLGRRPLAVILGGALLLALPLLAAYPINATDVFRYFIRGRIAAVHGQSPYALPPAAFPADPFLPLAGEWAGETSPYSPLWEIVAAGLSALAGDRLLLGVLLFKGLALACFMITAAVIWSLLPPGRARPAYALLWAWNPALLLTFALNGHNDALMLLWLVLGYWLMRRGRPAAGLWLMALAALTKPVAALAWPFFFIDALRRLDNGRAKARFAVLAIGGAAALAWLAFLPWAGAAGVWRAPVELALRLAREAGGGAGFSPAVWVYMAFDRRVSIEVIGLVATALFLGFALWLLWRAGRGRSPLRGAADAFFGYLATALNFRLWYAVWPFPWLLLDAAGETVDETADYRLRAGLWFLLTSQLSVVVYGHLRVYLFGGDQSIAHLLGVPFVFGLPWLLARLPGRLSRFVHAA
jgi:hypothetical protein